MQSGPSCSKHHWFNELVSGQNVLVSTISNSQLFLLKKSYSHFFSKNISVYAIFNDQSFNDTLTKYIVSFKQLSPDLTTCIIFHK